MDRLLAEPRFDGAKAHNAKGIALWRKQQNNSAEDEFKESIRLNPSIAEAHDNLAMILGEAKKFGEAESESNLSISLAKNDNTELANAHCNYGTTLGKMGRFADAVVEFRTATNLDPKLALAHGSLARALCDSGDCGNVAASEAQLATKLAPGDVRIREQAGSVFLSRGEWSRAEVELREAVTLNPLSIHTRTEHAFALLQMGRFDQSLPESERVLAEDPQNVEAHGIAGFSLARIIREIEDARRLFWSR
jgi:Flp pilus assembly protein TadD